MLRLAVLLVGVTIAHGVPPQKAPDSSSSEESFTLEVAPLSWAKKEYSVGILGPSSFFRAWRNCIEEGKTFATVESISEQHKLMKLIAEANVDYFIGATRIGIMTASAVARSHGNHDFVWVTSDERLRYDNLGEVSSEETDDCVKVRPNGMWQLVDCFSKKLPYICQELH